MSDDTVKVDAIVVGGGPGGLAAGLAMAAGGLEVIVVERGEYAGSKNVGGLFYGTVLNSLIPDAYKEAPIERTVSRRSVTYLGDGQQFSVSFGADAWSEEPYNNTYVVHRSQFDRWLAGKAEEAGCSLLEGMLVDDLLYEGDGEARRAVGVRLRGDEELRSDVVVLADGANCLVTEKAVQALGLQGGTRKQEFAVGVKEIIGLPRETIDARFNLQGREGVALDFIGRPFDGIIGGGFLYTASEAVHIGAVARIESLVQAKLSPNQLIDRFKTHPAVRRLLEGGDLLEYSGHMLPEGGFDAIGELSGNGVMIVGDAAGLLNLSLYKEGTNHAMESGKLAGERAVAARQAGDFSKAFLSGYDAAVREGVGMKDVRKYRELPDILESTPQLLSDYPARLTQMAVDMFTVTGEPKAEIQKRARRRALHGLPKLRCVRDLLRARKLL